MYLEYIINILLYVFISYSNPIVFPGEISNPFPCFKILSDLYTSSNEEPRKATQLLNK
jgi:hypothetical protein